MKGTSNIFLRFSYFVCRQNGIKFEASNYCWFRWNLSLWREQGTGRSNTGGNSRAGGRLRREKGAGSRERGWLLREIVGRREQGAGIAFT